MSNALSRFEEKWERYPRGVCILQDNIDRMKDQRYRTHSHSLHSFHGAGVALTVSAPRPVAVCHRAYCTGTGPPVRASRVHY